MIAVLFEAECSVSPVRFELNLISHPFSASALCINHHFPLLNG